MQTDSDYRDNQRDAQKRWREKNPDYWKRWRSAHPEYVERNRVNQRQRNGKRLGDDGESMKDDASGFAKRQTRQPPQCLCRQALTGWCRRIAKRQTRQFRFLVRDQPVTWSVKDFSVIAKR